MWLPFIIIKMLMMEGSYKMKICFFGYIGLTKKEGASLSLINVMEEMVKRGNEVYFIVNRKELALQLTRRGIRCVKLLTYTMRQDTDENGIMGTIKYYLKDLVNRWAIIYGVHKLHQYKFDAIHINGIDNHVGAAIATYLQVPYFWHIRQFLQEDLGKRLVREEIVLSYLSKANGVIGISEAVKIKYENVLKRPVRVIYNGIPLQNYDLGEVSRFTEERTRILLAGRITENKGQIEAVQAVAELKNRGINKVTLTLVGNAETEYLTKIKRIIKDERIENFVRILDYCDDLNELRRNSDIGLVCSKNEAFGRVTVEYMCAEMLVIGANTGGTVELIKEGETGLLYQQGNADSLANQIEYAIKNSMDMKRIAKNSKEYAFSNFSIARVCDEILELYSHPEIPFI